MNWLDGSKKTVLLDPVTSVGTFWTAPGYSKFTAFCAEADISPSDEAENPLTVDTAYISEDEDKETINSDDVDIIRGSLRGSQQGNLRLRGSYNNTSKRFWHL
jgi:hypothetical protein